MFYVSEALMIKSASASLELDPDARRECEGIMNQIYKEDPSYWPYGLNVDGHDGGVYMIRQASTDKAVGFVGWQERKQGHHKVGLYSVGVLPEFRGNGYARDAVGQLLREKSAGVDRVQAFILPHNKPSLALARSLDIPVVHNA
jgi:RimJ/RimL family protein N-acetyltransferase